jgi:hypothetical protein
MSRFAWSLAISLLAFGTLTAQLPTGEAVIRGPAGPSEIVITTTKRLAGAVDSLTWNGKEFIDSLDHGRQLQSACSFDLAKPGQFWAECFNPTEAGSLRDHTGAKSTSRLLYLKADKNRLSTVTQPAFWLAPEEKSQGRPALNKQILSDHLIAKQITIGTSASAHAIDYRVTFTIPPGEQHTLAQFEAVTGYMPAEFRKFYTLDPISDDLKPIDDGPGEQAKPLIFATENGSHAMGIWSPDSDKKPGYGRFRFERENVVKWNCVFRVRDPKAVPTGEYSYRMIVAVGSLQNVRDTLVAVVKTPASR